MLLTLIDASLAPRGAAVEEEVSLAALRTNVETWYDDAMDRVSGVYRRNVQIWLLIIGLLVAGVIGADTFTIANSLATNAALRSAVVAQAGRAATADSDKGFPTSPRAYDELMETHVPFGYGDVWPLNLDHPEKLAFKAAGLIITAFAISLGAPFWFDLLQKVANIRAAGEPPKRSDAPETPVPG